MADGSAIEWTDATWNPVVGCSVVSPGYTNCYAMKMAARIERMNPKALTYQGLTMPTKAGPVWTGEVSIAWNVLEQPLRWARPRRIFVNSMGDMFHEGLTDEEIAEVFGVAIAAVHLRGHKLQILTKRAKRMRDLLNDEEFWEIANGMAESQVMERVDPLDRRKDDARATLDDYGPDKPPPGIWLGVSAEDQARADERIPHLLETPAAVRFLSCEPLLEPVDLLKWFDPTGACCGGEPEFRCDNCPADADWRYSGQCTAESLNEPRIDWVIAGGESGPRARPAHPDWFRALRDQCVAAGVSFFMKQMPKKGPIPDDLMIREFPDAA